MENLWFEFNDKWLIMITFAAWLIVGIKSLAAITYSKQALESGALELAAKHEEDKMSWVGWCLYPVPFHLFLFAVVNLIPLIDMVVG